LNSAYYAHYCAPHLHYCTLNLHRVMMFHFLPRALVRSAAPPECNISVAIVLDSSTTEGKALRAAVALTPSAFSDGVVAAWLCKGKMLQEVATLLEYGCREALRKMACARGRAPGAEQKQVAESGAALHEFIYAPPTTPRPLVISPLVLPPPPPPPPPSRFPSKRGAALPCLLAPFFESLPLQTNKQQEEFSL
jgi:hypothetical protein